MSLVSQRRGAGAGNAVPPQPQLWAPTRGVLWCIDPRRGTAGRNNLPSTRISSVDSAPLLSSLACLDPIFHFPYFPVCLCCLLLLLFRPSFHSFLFTLSFIFIFYSIIECPTLLYASQARKPPFVNATIKISISDFIPIKQPLASVSPYLTAHEPPPAAPMLGHPFPLPAFQCRPTFDAPARRMLTPC